MVFVGSLCDIQEAQRTVCTKFNWFEAACNGKLYCIMKRSRKMTENLDC